MQYLIVLANGIPWVMGPASLVAAMLGICLIRTVVRFAEKTFNVMAVGVILALMGGMSIVLFLR
jgi:hypothetical protein